MEENQKSGSKTNKRKKRKSGESADSTSAKVQQNQSKDLPTKPVQQPKTPKQLQTGKQALSEEPPKQEKHSDLQQPKSPNQPTDKQSKSQQQTPKPQKQPKPQNQSEKQHTPDHSEKQPSPHQQPKLKKLPKSPKQPSAENQSPPASQEPQKQPSAEKQTKHKKPENQSRSENQSLLKQPSHEKQSPLKDQPPQKQPSPEKQTKQSKPKKQCQSGNQSAPLEQPSRENQPPPQKQPSPEKQIKQSKPKKQSVCENQPPPDNQPQTQLQPERKPESDKRQRSANSESKTEKSESKSLKSLSPETNEPDSKCVPSGDSAPCKVTSSAPSAQKCECNTDVACARNASAIIASEKSVQETKMTGPVAAQTEGRPAVSKTREEIEAERKARKEAKQAKKVKGKKPDEEGKEVKQLVEGIKQVKIEGKVEGTIESKEKSSQPKVDVKKPSEEKPNDKPAGEAAPQKSKAELRAERRAIQEAQRAAKAAGKDSKQSKQSQPAKPAAEKQAAAATAAEKPSPKSKTSSEPKSTERRVKLFSHLYQCSFKSISQSLKVNHPLYHPAIVRLGVQYAERVVLGSNARCVALLHALKQVVADYETPPQKEFSRGLEAYLQPNVDFLQQCRPLAVSMTNALRHVKRQLTALPNNIKDSQARQKLQDSIDTYIKEQIETAAEAIGYTAKDKIADGDVILVYACSSLVLHSLKITHEEGKKFSVVVVDSLPWLEGREMLRRLVSLGIKCTYVHISASSFVMREVSKVLLGAHALLTNGYVMSRAGSSQIALLAHSYNVPVLVFCETHKFSERVQTDSFVYNELANPDELVGKKRNIDVLEKRTLPLESWRDLPYLTLLNLVYDVTPPDLVTAVVTELAILPCTSVPVILRIKPTDC